MILAISSIVSTLTKVLSKSINKDLPNSIQLKKIALILNDIYESFDIVLRALMAHDTQKETNFARQYLKFLILNILKKINVFGFNFIQVKRLVPVSYTHLRAHET